MIKNDIMQEKQYISVKDIENIFNCSSPVAQKIMRQIKSVSDRLGVKGKVTLSDYECWYKKNFEEIGERK